MTGTQVPPVLPPLTFGSGGDGDDGHLTLETVDAMERRALLSVWAWQTEASECDAGAPREGPLMRSMVRWPDGSPGWTLSRLAPRSMIAKLDDVPLAVVL